jgi:uracil-DNA glycosylase
MTNSIENKLKVIQGQVFSCTKCALHKTKTNYVFARGNPHSYITLVGEAGGEEEDKTGLPFVGPSGKLLDKTLTELGLDVTQDIYVCNIIKCRPPNNRRPTDDEIEQCFSYLDEQLKVVNPKVIVALGNTAVEGLLVVSSGITKIHGRFFNLPGSNRPAPIVMPVYHPSYVLRNGTSGQVFEDFQKDLRTAILKMKELTHTEQTTGP